MDIIEHLQRHEGRVAWTSTGSGPLLVLVPGMGDLRGTWRGLAAPLVTAGYRVVATDLRGHGDSDTTFTTHGDASTGGDVLALVEHLGDGPAVLVGSSMGGSAALWAAAERPDLVAGLVLVSPFLDEPQTRPVVRAVNRAAYRLLFSRPWGARLWASYYRGPLHHGAPTPWLTEHVAAIHASLRDPAHLRSLRRLAAQLDHGVVGERLAEVTAPALVLIGEHDPDFRDVPTELERARTAIGAEAIAVPNAAHYAHHQAPGLVLERTTALLAGLPRTATRWAVPSARGAVGGTGA